MVEAVTVGRTHIIEPLSPLLSRFWYLSSLTSGFCGEFPANPMIPETRGGGGIPRPLHAEAQREAGLELISPGFYSRRYSHPPVVGQAPRTDGQRAKLSSSRQDEVRDWRGITDDPEVAHPLLSGDFRNTWFSSDPSSHVRMPGDRGSAE